MVNERRDLHTAVCVFLYLVPLAYLRVKPVAKTEAVAKAAEVDTDGFTIPEHLKFLPSDTEGGHLTFSFLSVHILSFPIRTKKQKKEKNQGAKIVSEGNTRLRCVIAASF